MALRALCVSLASLMLAGCATGYHDASNPLTGWAGGFWDTKGPGQLIKIGFSGNGFISREKVGTYVLYRSAEVTQREGKDFFVMYENLPAAISDRRSSERTVSTIGGKAATYVYVLLKTEPGPDVLSASEVIARLRPEVER
ncbi:CC0125/CC1285 family lipoprotein [Stenotrophobium rhamnosiphilum]|uniref:Lipoprotein n=1 Tax=Stenotrophobium rhamnosiphilum TaxID=2029166 RepID=A0A2T5MK80_9GAMM|nr:hypothetical protein [Stenotrophobium rhamnosiphilum]PTU32986.1 hypothetical protein CJD38_02405 [Stenotrophobium rhamnosiphilum]